MICHEAPGPGEFCHRWLVAAWLKAKLGIEIPEIADATKPKYAKPNPNVLVKVRFLKDYRTQISQDEPNKFIDKMYRAGEVAEIPAWKVADLLARGIAELAA